MVDQTLTSLFDPNVNGFAQFVEYPGHNCCTIFDENHFGRPNERKPDELANRHSRTYCNGGSRQVVNLHNWGWNDRMQSFICGKNVWYDFCNDDNEYDCYGAENSHSGAGHMRNQKINYLENKASLLIMGPYDPRQIGAVTLFEDSSCQGGMGRYYWNPESIENGTHYEIKDLVYGGLRNNRMNSLMVPKGYTVELYEYQSFYGRKQVVEGAFTDASEEMVCVESDWGNGVSSLIVKKQSQGAAQGYWQSVTSTESIEHIIHIGLSTGNTDRSKGEEAQRLNEAVDFGLVFINSFMEMFNLNGNKQAVQRDVTRTYGFDYSQATKISCSVPEGEAGAGIWQWVVSTGDGMTTSFSPHTVCRTGALFNVEPACPYFACANANCSACIDGWDDEN